MNADTRKAEWIQLRRTTWSWFTGLTNKMIDSEAFQALRSVHSVKVLIYFWQKAEYAKEKRKPGHESPIGNLNKILNQGKMSFEYRIAEYRGMRPDQFVKALRELHRFGFIDVKEHGRGVKGEYSKFSLSDRWKMYGTDRWEEIPFPTGERAGWASKEFKRKQKERREKDRYANAELPTTALRSYSNSELPNDYGNAELKTPVFTPPSTTESRSLLISTMPLTPTRDEGKVIKKVRIPNSRSKNKSAPIQRDDDGTTSSRYHPDIGTNSPNKWRPPLSEIWENVVEILWQGPDPRADDPQFVQFISVQLCEVLSGRLDPARLHLDLQARHDLDVWTVDLLFTIATIDYRREMAH